MNFNVSYHVFKLEYFIRLVHSIHPNWKSPSRIIGEAFELLFQFDFICPFCHSTSCSRYPTNTKFKDFMCNSCHKDFQIKAKFTPSGSSLIHSDIIRIPGASFHSTSLSNDVIYIIFLYTIEKNIHFIVKHLISSHYDVIPRKPLSPTAIRSGWVGCVIQLRVSNFSSY